MIVPHMPPARQLPPPRTTDVRAMVDALPCILATRCQWRMLPKDRPPCSTVQRFFYRWREDVTTVPMAPFPRCTS